jgi:hypothetical protein
VLNTWRLYQDGAESQQDVSRTQDDSSTAPMASYRAAYLLANEIKPFSDGEFFRKKNLQYTVQVTCPQEINCFLY